MEVVCLPLNLFVRFFNKFFKGQTSGVVGKVVNTSAKTTEDSLTLHVKSKTGNSGSTFYTEFQDGEILDEVQQDSDGLGGYSLHHQTINLKFYQSLALQM